MRVAARCEQDSGVSYERARKQRAERRKDRAGASLTGIHAEAWEHTADLWLHGAYSWIPALPCIWKRNGDDQRTLRDARASRGRDASKITHPRCGARQRTRASGGLRADITRLRSVYVPDLIGCHSFA